MYKPNSNIQPSPPKAPQNFKPIAMSNPQPKMAKQSHSNQQNASQRSKAINSSNNLNHALPGSNVNNSINSNVPDNNSPTDEELLSYKIETSVESISERIISCLKDAKSAACIRVIGKNPPKFWLNSWLGAPG